MGQTTKSIIPEDWEQKSFSECVEKTSIPRQIKIPQGQYQRAGEYPIVDQGADFIAGYTNDKSKLYSGQLPVIVFGDHTRIFKYVDFAFSLGADGTKLLCPKKFLNPQYFYYYLSGLSLESKGYNRHYKYLKENLISFPEMLEQRKISHILLNIKNVIEQQEKIIAKTKELKRSLMHRLFTRGLRGEELKETEIGLMPKSWETKRLKDVCEKPQYGFTATATVKEIGPKFLRITDITEDGVNWASVPYCKCPADKIKKYILRKWDILFVRIGATTGKSFIISQCPHAIYASYLIRVRTTDILDSLFLCYFFNSESYWKQINANKGSSLKQGVNGSILANLITPVPHSKEEQEEISKILKSVDEKINQANIKYGALSALFKTMLNNLMTGQVRVKDIDFGADMG